MSYLKRITDLFTEGAPVYLGDDGGSPVVIWVNQLNSFQLEDARQDGMLRRSERMAQLANPDSPERQGLEAELETLDTDEIAKRYVGQRTQEILIEVYNDLEIGEEYRDVMERVMTLPDILESEGAASDDPRRAALAKDQERWTAMIAEARNKALQDALEDAKQIHRDDLLKAYIEKWRESATIDVFMVERRMTELWFALRECAATDVDGKRTTWEHAECDHSKRLVVDRPDVRGLPEAILSKASDALNGLRVDPREAGNSDAPASSSDSLGLLVQEGLSTASIPVAPSTEPPTP